MTKFWNHLLLLALASFALFFCSGCNFDPIAYLTGYDPEIPVRYVVRCEAQSQTLQLYEEQAKYESDFDPNFPYNITEVPADSPINGKSCSVSTENQNRPFTTSEAISTGLVSAAVPAQPSVAARTSTTAPLSAAAPRASASGTSLNDFFHFLVPLLFPPGFPITDAQKYTPPCPSGLKTYLVNHLQNTVTSVGLCPMAVKREITVRSNPLQIAVTPDGSTALVTSYDSGITYIDTATDTVTFTLDTPGYNPSGIAISPDGTRAYVTHYLDQHPALLVIDIPNRKMLTTIPLPYLYPRVVVLTPDGTQAWVNYYTGSYITIVDLLSASVSTTLIPGPPISMGMAFNPSGTKAFVAADPNLVLVIDTASQATLAQIAVGPYPSDVVADPDGETVYTNSSTLTGMWWIDARKNKLKAVPANPQNGGSMGLVVF